MPGKRRTVRRSMRRSVPRLVPRLVPRTRVGARAARRGFAFRSPGGRPRTGVE